MRSSAEGASFDRHQSARDYARGVGPCFSQRPRPIWSVRNSPAFDAQHVTGRARGHGPLGPNSRRAPHQGEIVRHDVGHLLELDSIVGMSGDVTQAAYLVPLDLPIVEAADLAVRRVVVALVAERDLRMADRKGGCRCALVDDHVGAGAVAAVYVSRNEMVIDSIRPDQRAQTLPRRRISVRARIDAHTIRPWPGA